MIFVTSIGTFAATGITGPGLTELSKIDQNASINHWASVMSFYYYIELIFYPVFFSILVGQIFNLEHRNNTQFQLFHTPIRIHYYYLAKVILFLGILIIFSVFLATVNLGFLWMIAPLNDNFQYGDFNSASKIFYSLNVSLIVCALGHYSLIAFLSTWIKNNFVLLTIILLSQIFSFTNLKFFPSSFPYNNFLYGLNDSFYTHNYLYHLISFLLFLTFFVLGSFFYQKGLLNK